MEFIVIPKEKLDFWESTLSEIKDRLLTKKPKEETPQMDN